MKSCILAGAVSTLLLIPAALHAQIYTAPYGPGGTWNAYQVVTTPANWAAADTAAKAKTAADTGLPALAGNTTTGHLVQISSEDENTFVALAAAQAPNSGNSNIWLGLNDVASEGNWEWTGTTGGSGENGEEVLGVETDFAAWAPGEPNNAGSAEHAAELRTDGRWNDNNGATQTRRYVIEWEISAAAAIEGALQIPVYYTGPYGPDGKWNLYRVVATGNNSFSEVHDLAISQTAASTGVAGVTNGALTGHVASINSAAENDFIFRIANQASNNTVTTWIGATDDPAFGGEEAGSSKTEGWVWAGTSEPFTYQKFRRRYPNNAEEPNNAGAGENFVEIQNVTGYWNDVGETSGTGGTFRRYVVEWSTEQDAPIAGAALPPGLLPAPFPTLAGADAAGTWDLRFLRGAANGGANFPNALGVAFGVTPGATATNGTRPVLNFTDGVTGTDTAGRSTSGLFWPRLPYLGDQAGDDNQFVLLAKTKVTIATAGRYVFNVHADDGHHFRLTGGPANGIELLQVDGLGHSDPGLPGAFYYPANNDATGARGIYQLAAGTYDVEFLAYEGSGGSIFEIAWAPVPAEWALGSDFGNWGADWKLLGGAQGGDPVIPASLSLPAPTGGNWSVGTTTPAGAAFPTLAAAVEALQSEPLTTETYPVVNFADPDNAGNRGRFGNDAPFPGDAPGDENFFAAAGRGQITIPEPGLYTVAARVDDWFALRVSAPAVVRGRVWGVTSQGHIDANDAQTLRWDVGTSDDRVAVHFPTAGTYDLDFVFAEGSGGSSIELYYAPGVQLAEADTTTWRLIGNPGALTPALPATLANAPEFGDRLWGLHTVHNVSFDLASLADAVSALQGADGDHTTATAPVLNFVDPDAPGVGGIFAGDLAVPGESEELDDDNFALHARGRLEVETAGRYTFAVKHSDGFALRINGAAWLANLASGTAAGIDPADASTLVFATGTTALTDRTSRAAVDLAAGTYEVDFITFDRSADFHAEVYVARGHNIGTGEYATSGTAAAANSTAGGGAVISLNDGWRLVGYTPSGLATLGIDADGWAVQQTAPRSTAPPDQHLNGNAWGASGQALAAADAWLDSTGAGAASVTTVQGVPQINFNDPGFGGPGSFPNDQPNPTNTPANNSSNTDDHYYATRMTGTLIVEKEGTYAIGFQSDDGQYFEFLTPSAPLTTPVFTRLTANATGTADPVDAGLITESSQGVEGARFQVDGGTGNSRTVAEVHLTPGAYPIKAVWYEGTGGSYNEIFAAPAPAYGRPLSLLVTDGASAEVADLDGLTLAAGGVIPPPTGNLVITNLTWSATNTLGITWTSTAGATYTIETSPSLQSNQWTTVEASYASGGATTTYTSPAQDTAATPQLFWRVRQNP